MNFPALIFWALIFWSATTSPGRLLVLLLASMPFASLALLPPAVVGGMSILPQSMFAVVLILKVVAPEVINLSPRLLNALSLRVLGVLALFLLTGILTTLIMPRLFLEEVIILPTRSSWLPALLTPIQANFTQSSYVTLSVLVALAVTLTADQPRFAETLLRGVLAGGIVTVATGLIDMVAASTGLESFLAPFRTADYAYLTEDAIGGIRRVVGFTPEASAYGPICVQFASAILLLRSLYAEGRQRSLATIVAVGLVAMALLSTSSTAYAGVAVLGLVYAANLLRRVATASTLGKSGLTGEMLAGFGLTVAVLFVLVARSNLFDPLLNMINELIFRKAQTSSYYERSHWNTVAFDAVSSTWGLGVGFGSTRTSNWFAAIISNAGLIGAALMGIFLIQTFFRRPTWPTPASLELLPGLKLSLLPALAMAGVSASGPDFGIWMGVAFGAIAGVAAFRPGPSSVGQVATGNPSPTRLGGRRAMGARAFGRPTPPVSSRRWRQRTGPDTPAPRPSS